MAKEKDLFHGEGNSTSQLPKKLRGKTVLTDPHAKAGKVLPTTKKVEKGWNK